MAEEVTKTAAYLLPALFGAYMLKKRIEAFTKAKSFNKHKKLYRQRRDEFQSNEDAMAELDQWKSRNCNYNYVELTGMVPSKMLAIPNANHFPFAKCDTWFSEFADHNDNGLILSESAESYIIGNLASYDKRQYPEWLNSNYRPGVNTPEGQGFGHVLVIPKRRIFNIVDPDATAKDASAIRELRDHFKTFWRNGGSPKIVQRARASFDDQNAKLAAKKSTQHLYYQLLPILEADFERLSRMYGQLGVHDLEFAFHAFPDASVGHLHMHVFPKLSELRKFSTRHHDWKTIPIEAVLEVEEEDRRKRRESTEG